MSQVCSSAQIVKNWNFRLLTWLLQNYFLFHYLFTIHFFVLINSKKDFQLVFIIFYIYFKVISRYEWTNPAIS